jgi:hypothetical protein
LSVVPKGTRFTLSILESISSKRGGIINFSEKVIVTTPSFETVIAFQKGIGLLFNSGVSSGISTVYSIILAYLDFDDAEAELFVDLVLFEVVEFVALVALVVLVVV